MTEDSDRYDEQSAAALIEIVTGDVDSEGNVIIDDAVYVIDSSGTVVAAGETITFESPDGVVTRSELGEDGEMHLVGGDEEAVEP